MPKINSTKKHIRQQRPANPLFPAWIHEKSMELGIPQTYTVSAYEWAKTPGSAQIRESFRITNANSLKTLVLDKYTRSPGAVMFRKDITWYSWSLPRTELEVELECETKEAWWTEKDENMFEFWKLKDGRVARVHRELA
jgi:hypothetical protein